MAALDMAKITEYLERSMQKNCSMSKQGRRSVVGDGLGMTDESDDHIPISDRNLELNSHISIPSHLEQCLDLKTGEIYYINSNNGMRVKEDPRTLVSNNNADKLTLVSNNNADEFSEESDISVFSEEDSSYYESEESSSESSRENHKEEEEVLVVAGCKACFMYLMVPKLLKECPKCSAQLLHFDRSHSASP
ncbi:hypothetical protein EUTSA_v10008849mg [Eutrema salsugineum]|uniref:WW domain-containing protein n=1 Tax=Eutrema salsugineum TaxID=72664 RepID=V4K8W3_EUTSA|nr:uncharacterized protein LOC18992262 [Eutrema salsugineum]ESQ34055.1 hypothetical protein EUTSA_v10008849mg [Eutrema salsugineum]